MLLHGGEDQEERQVDADDRVEVVGGEEGGEVAEQDGDDCGQEGGEQEPDDLAPQADFHPDQGAALPPREPRPSFWKTNRR